MTLKGSLHRNRPSRLRLFLLLPRRHRRQVLASASICGPAKPAAVMVRRRRRERASKKKDHDLS
jgi:hypothetical protein